MSKMTGIQYAFYWPFHDVQRGMRPMNDNDYQIRQLADELQPPETGKQSLVLLDDANTTIVLFAFANGRRMTLELSLTIRSAINN